MNGRSNVSENRETDVENQKEQTYKVEAPEEGQGFPTEEEVEESQSEVQYRHPVIVNVPAMINIYYISPLKD